MAKREPAGARHGNSNATGGSLWAASGLLLTVFAFAAMLTFSSADWPNPHVYPNAEPVQNACGRVGAWLAYHVIRLLGTGGYILLLFAAAGFYWRLARGRVELFWQRAASSLVLALVISTTVDVLAPHGARNLPLGYAGVAASFVGQLLRENFNPFGTFLILTYCALAALFFAVDGLGARVTRWAEGMGGSAVSAGRRSIAHAGEAAARLGAVLRRPANPVQARAGTAGVSCVSAPTARRPADRRRRDRQEPAEPQRPPPADDFEEAEADLDGPASPPPAPRRRPAQAAAPVASPAQDSPGRLEGVKNIVFRHHRPDPASEKTGCYPAVLDDWVLPPVSLLGECEYRLSARQETLAREKARVLEETLADFRIEAPVVEIETGPVITMFELRLAPGIKVSQIVALSNDIARALKAPNVRVVAPIPGKNTVGIEVPRIDREKVRMRELMTTTGNRAKKMLLPLYLGKNASGASMVYDLAKMPHMLIAGTTGSGKSVCINSIIMSVLMTQRPDRVKLIMIDPKMVELSAFKDVPHLMCPIVTDMNKAEQILDWACSKMDERYSLLAEAGVRNIIEYNRLTPEQLLERFNPAGPEEAQHIPPHLPYIIIVVDELADLMMTSAKEVEYHLARLAQKSRAVGVHIVVATQRPEAKVVTGLIKSNLPCRCAFRVAARMDSRIVLDQNGAEGLLGQGDMLFLPPGSANLVRAQGTFVEDDELQATVVDLRSKGKCEYHPELMKIRTGPNAEVGERDELFEDAVRIILETQRGSVSLLQRRLTVGYSRASRLIDQMSGAGIVGEYKGSQAREVLMTLEEWDALKQQVQQELSEDYAADRDDEPAPQGHRAAEAGDVTPAPAAAGSAEEARTHAADGAQAHATAAAEGDGDEEEGTAEDPESNAQDDDECEYEYDYEYVDEDEGEEEDTEEDGEEDDQEDEEEEEDEEDEEDEEEDEVDECDDPDGDEEDATDARDHEDPTTLAEGPQEDPSGFARSSNADKSSAGAS